MKGFEIPKKVHLSFEEFTIANSLLTPSMKIKRREVGALFDGEIKALYKEGL